MKILQVQFKNRNGHTLRGIASCLTPRGQGTLCGASARLCRRCSGYKSMYTPSVLALWQRQGIGSACPFSYGNGERWRVRGL